MVLVVVFVPEQSQLSFLEMGTADAVRGGGGDYLLVFIGDGDVIYACMTNTHLISVHACSNFHLGSLLFCSFSLSLSFPLCMCVCSIQLKSAISKLGLDNSRVFIESLGCVLQVDVLCVVSGPGTWLGVRIWIWFSCVSLFPFLFSCSGCVVVVVVVPVLVCGVVGGLMIGVPSDCGSAAGSMLNHSVFVSKVVCMSACLSISLYHDTCHSSSSSSSSSASSASSNSSSTSTPCVSLRG